MNSESKLGFCERSFKFLKNSVFFCVFYPCGYTTGGSIHYNPQHHGQLLARLKELIEHVA